MSRLETHAQCVRVDNPAKFEVSLHSGGYDEIVILGLFRKLGFPCLCHIFGFACVCVCGGVCVCVNTIVTIYFHTAFKSRILMRKWELCPVLRYDVLNNGCCKYIGETGAILCLRAYYGPHKKTSSLLKYVEVNVADVDAI